MKDPNHQIILQIFKYRCINNPAHAVTEVHELIPKSQYIGDPLVIENRIPLCQQCHDQIHGSGAMNHIENLTEKRDRFLDIHYGTKDLQQIISNLGI